jgi:transcriptional regulator with XRE-family HTH domain
VTETNRRPRRCLDASQTVSRNVRRLRLARGWTQAEAGQRFGQITGVALSNAAWSMAEKQTRPREWTAGELIALTRLFGVTFDELFAPEESTPTCPMCGQEVKK